MPFGGRLSQERPPKIEDSNTDFAKDLHLGLGPRSTRLAHIETFLYEGFLPHAISPNS